MSFGKQLVIGVCLVCFSVVEAGAQEGLSALAERSSGAVVLLQIFDLANRQVGSGSGFFVAPDRVVSNRHVVEGAHRVVAVLADSTEVEITGLLASDDLNDLVVLKSSFAHTAALKVSSSDDLVVGEEIVVLGSPAGLSGTLSDGIVSAIRPDGLPAYAANGEETPPIFQISAPISPGSSGSPVMNLKGDVVGVAVSQLRFGQNLNFAVPSEPLRKLIRQSEATSVQIIYGQVSSVPTRDYVRNLGISFVFFGILYWVLLRKKGPRALR